MGILSYMTDLGMAADLDKQPSLVIQDQEDNQQSDYNTS